MNDDTPKIEPFPNVPVSDDDGEWVCGEWGCTKKPKTPPIIPEEIKTTE